MLSRWDLPLQAALLALFALAVVAIILKPVLEIRRRASGDDDAPVPEHLRTYFTAEIPASGLPSRFGIVTAHDPGGRVRSPEENREADAELREHLRKSGLLHFRATGGSKDGSHAEPGFAIVASSPEEIRTVSRRFRQLAFFWIEDGIVFVINTEGRERHRVAPWSERVS